MAGDMVDQLYINGYGTFKSDPSHLTYVIGHVIIT